MKTLLSAALLLLLVSSAARAQINAGELKPQPDLPFTMTQVATFNLPWRIAFLPAWRSRPMAGCGKSSTGREAATS